MKYISFEQALKLIRRKNALASASYSEGISVKELRRLGYAISTEDSHQIKGRYFAKKKESNMSKVCLT